MYYQTHYDSPVGRLTLACSEDSLVGLWIEGQKYFLGTLSGQLEENGDTPVFRQTKEWLDMYFSGMRVYPADLPLSPIGGEFRRMVWKCLCGIPYGEVTTYKAISKQIAAQMGRKSMSPQAIGGAVGHNPISIIIPCHRVLGSDGSLTGYAAGVDKKLYLLGLEGAFVKYD